jgi:hypothetical protein
MDKIVIVALVVGALITLQVITSRQRIQAEQDES